MVITMFAKKTGIILALIALLASVIPAPPAQADGAASTRNIILGGALVGGTLLIINHNRKVHQKYDELTNARNQAQAERDQAYAASEQSSAAASSYQSQLAARNRELAAYKRTVAMQHNEITKLRKEVSMGPGAGTATKSSFIAPMPAKPPSVPQVRVASLSYGWGQL
jgi:hypothetical protein